VTTAHPVDELWLLSRRFGSSETRRKLDLLARIAKLARLSRARLVKLHDTLLFMRAYPDDANVLRAVCSHVVDLRRRVETATGGEPRHPALENSGLPGTCNTYAYSHAVLERLVRTSPHRLEVDWDADFDESLLTEGLGLTIVPGETRGLEDESIALRDWLQARRPDPRQTDLEVILHLLRNSSLSAEQQMHVFEKSDVPVVYPLSEPGSGRCEVGFVPDRVVFQREPIARERFPLPPRIKARPRGSSRLSSRAGRKMLDLSLRALCCRNLEIYPLIYSDPKDVTVLHCGRGLEVVLAGMLPEFRSVPESLLFFLILKNGVPIAYGPASVFLGCCEMGINLFPEFRGGEIRSIYAELMRALYHLAKVRYFFLTSYGMGEDNDEALESGAFWFYRKLGFWAENPQVESLAREQEKIMRQRPGYRCSMAMLRRLSHTQAYLDLSGGVCRPLDFGRLGRAVSGLIAHTFAGDGTRAERECTRRLVRLLEIRRFARWRPAEKRAMRQLAPVLGALPGLADWPARDVDRLVAAIRARGSLGELEYLQKLARLPRLADEFHSLGSE
jgi:hypothetical protein